MCYTTVLLFLGGSWFSTWRFRDPGSFCLCLKYSLVLSALSYAFGHVHREWEYGDMEQTHLLTIQSGSNTNEGARCRGSGRRKENSESREREMWSLAEQPSLSKHPTDVMLAQIFGERLSIPDKTRL